MTPGELFLGTVTIMLAIVAVAAIVINVILRSKDVRENRRLRDELREPEIKLQALDEIRGLACDFRQFVFLAGVTDKSDLKQFILQSIDLQNKHEMVVNLAEIFDKQLQDKVDTLSEYIMDFSKAFTGKPAKYGKKIFEPGIKENDDLAERIFESVTKVIWAATQEKVKLFIKNQNIKG